MLEHFHHSGWALLWVIGLHVVLTALPVAAGASLARRLGARDVPVSLAAGLVAGGGSAMVVFWAYWASPSAGVACSWALVVGSVVAIVFNGIADREHILHVLPPVGLWAAASSFVSCLGFARGGTESPLGTSAHRFSDPLPGDNVIPGYYADWFYRHGHETPALFGDWLSSDRPPLQVGYLLSQRPFMTESTELHYEVLGTVLQQQWVLGLYALLIAAGVSRLARGSALVAVLLADVAVVNSFFVWPKLLPAAMLLAACALVLTPLWEVVRRRPVGAALVAALAGLALMGHGSSMFGLVGIGLVVAFRGLPRLRWLAVAVAVGAIVVLPWSAYQKWADPPGNRLVKWQLAGQIPIDDRGSWETIVDEYGEAGWSGTLLNKEANVRALWGPPQLFGALKNREPAAALIEVRRRDAFYAVVPSLGLLLLGPAAMLVGHARMTGRDRKFALVAFATSAGACLAAVLLLFGAAAPAGLHVSSYLAPLLAAAGCAVALTAFGRRAAIACLAVYALIQLAVYVPVLDADSDSHWSLGALVVAAAALLTYVVVAVRKQALPMLTR